MHPTTVSLRLLMLAAAVSGFSICARAVPPEYNVTDHGLVLRNVSPDCPMIYDNDWWTDVPDAAYLWAKASLGKCRLKANIVSRDMWGWEKGYTYKIEQGMADCRKLLAAARASGLRHIPDPVLGAAEALQRPETGRIEDTHFTPTPGSDLIVAEARRASAHRPLLVFVGGPCTTVATAFLTDPSIAGRMIVFQIDGGAYNGSDNWSWDIAMKRCRFANWARGYFWDKLQTWHPEQFNELPRNPLGDLLRAYAFGHLAKANQWGDGAWIFYTFDHRCLTKAEVYDKVAITIPRQGNNLKAMKDDFFAAMMNPALYHTR